jgi:hypothetical protein
MILDEGRQYLVIRGEQVMGSHYCLEDALNDARYLAKIEPAHRFSVAEVSKVIVVHKPCED